MIRFEHRSASAPRIPDSRCRLVVFMIRVTNLTLASGTFVLPNISLIVPAGQYAVLMGRTGSGKTTLLEALCGLKKPSAGKIEFFGRDVTRLKPSDRGIGYVPQDGALFSTMTVRQHLAFALEIRRWSPAQIEYRVQELAELIGLTDLLHRYPLGLSGGESQRVSLGRALSFRPQILSLDEPLSALDDDSRLSMMSLLKRVQQETGVTVLHVTHNRLEAERLADYRLRIAGGEVCVVSSYEPAGNV